MGRVLYERHGSQRQLLRSRFGQDGFGPGTFAYLHERDLVDRIIVLSPKNAFGSWRDEWAACFGADRPLRSLCFHDPEFRGRSTRDKYSTLLFDYKRYDMILLNYESVALGRRPRALRPIAPWWCSMRFTR